jgi:toxin ParE1/3/4
LSRPSILAERNIQAAERLLERAEHLVGLLDDFPLMGRRRDDLGSGLRSMPVRGFPYLIFYRADAGGVVVLRILHGARRLRRSQFVDLPRA